MVRLIKPVQSNFRATRNITTSFSIGLGALRGSKQRSGNRMRENNSEEMIMSHFENAIGIVIASITVALIYCGLAFIEILDRIANMF